MSSSEPGPRIKPDWLIDWDRITPARPTAGADGPPPVAPAAPVSSTPSARPRIRLPRQTTGGATAQGSSRPPADAFLTRAGRRSRQRRRVNPLVGGVAALVLAGAGVGAYALLVSDNGSAPKSVPRTDAAKRHARVSFPARVNFVAGGVRFFVAPHPNQPWARLARAAPAGRGQRWATVAVIYRNLTNKSLTAEALELRVQDDRGRVYLPDPVMGNHGTELRAKAQIPVNRLVHGQLAYRVRTSARSLSLLVNATSRERLRVPLGAG
jgi:hypothetical protein